MAWCSGGGQGQLYLYLLPFAWSYHHLDTSDLFRPHSNYSSSFPLFFRLHLLPFLQVCMRDVKSSRRWRFKIWIPVCSITLLVCVYVCMHILLSLSSFMFSPFVSLILFIMFRFRLISSRLVRSACGIPTTHLRKRICAVSMSFFQFSVKVLTSNHNQNLYWASSLCVHFSPFPSGSVIC
jgi:hypothetical protein